MHFLYGSRRQRAIIKGLALNNRQAASMETELIVGAAVFDILAGEWHALAERGMTDTPFQTLAYQRAWWTHLQPPDSTLLTVIARDAAGTLAAIGCFYNFGGKLFFNGCVEETDYLDLIAPPEDAVA